VKALLTPRQATMLGAMHPCRSTPPSLRRCRPRLSPTPTIIYSISLGGAQSYISLAVGGQEGNCWDVDADPAHYDDAGATEDGHAVPGTDADLRTYLLPKLTAGWTSP
jgi:hypothetical protein